MSDESYSHAENDSHVYTHVDKTPKNDTFNPTEVLDHAHNVELYRLWKSAPAGSFKKLAMEKYEKDQNIVKTMEACGLVLGYYLYSMQYVFEVLKWVPKGIQK
jgi:hypothetical protein